MADKRFSTRTVHGGEPRVKPHHSVTTPIMQTSTFTFDDTEDLIAYKEAANGRIEYGRYGNPTVMTAERKLAELDGGEAALLFSSGMAAITITLLTILSSGDHLVVTDDCYRRSRQLVHEFLPRFGIETSQAPMGDYEALEAAIQPNTRLILSESPTNPYLRVLDLERLVQVARRHGLLTVIDSTFATPINQRPLEFGVDLVIHSATKYLGGHNDLLAGVVVGSEELITQLKESQDMIGAVSDPNSAYLLLRGLKTLALRVKRHNETGLQIAQALEKHPKVQRVFYPGLPSHPDHAVAVQQMEAYGGVVSFELDADLEQTGRFVDLLRIPLIGPSLGGVESLVIQVATATYYELSSEERAEVGIADALVRLATGIEDAEDLIADLYQALDQL